MMIDFANMPVAAASITLAASAIGAIDWAVLVLYLVATVLIGTMTGKKQDSLKEYCLAGQRIPWWAACISIVATDLSGISYMGVPAWLYEHDLKYNFGIFLMPLVMLVVIQVFCPVFYRAGVFTVYQFLERRFHPAARTVTAILFLVQRYIWLACAMYIPAVALTAFTDIPLWLCIVIVGVATTFYTMAGGMHAVIWTDLMQFIVLAGGLVVMILIGMARMDWDWLGVWQSASAMTAPASGTPYTTVVDFTPSLKTEATIWSIVFFYFVYNVGQYGTDQVNVQRYLTVGSFRELFKSVMSSAFVSIVTVVLMAAVGLIIVVLYHRTPALAQSLGKNVDMVLPHFVTNVLPVGMRGVIFAAIFAATMSTVSSALNSFSTVGVVDLYRRHVRPDATDEQSLRMAKWLTLVSGILTTLLGLLVALASTTILQTNGWLASIFVGPITGMFFLGVLTRRANLGGMLVGVVAGLTYGVLQWLVPAISDNINWLWTAPLSCVVTYVVGYVASFAFPAVAKPEGVEVVSPAPSTLTPTSVVPGTESAATH